MNIMIDLETMSLRPNAAIVSIGAVAFGYDNEPEWKTFYVNVELDNSCGADIDGETVMWWLEQSEESRKALFVPKPKYLPFALEDLVEFMTPYVDDNSELWCHNSFDSPIIKEAFRTCGLKFPISFRKERDIRTLLSLYGMEVQIPFTGVKHNALDDAIHQAKVVAHILKEMS